MGSNRVLENRCRRALSRRGLQLKKNGRRDPKALDFGGCMIVSSEDNTIIAGGTPRPYSMTIVDVAAWLEK